MKTALYILAVTLFIACGQISNTNTKPEIPHESEASSSTQKIEEAHSKEDFLANDAVQFDIVLEFGGTERLNGTMTLATNSSAGKISYKDGKALYYNQNKVYGSPDAVNTAGARFTAYTWSYFFLFPYKLSDPGTQWTPADTVSLNGKTYLSQKLTFANGIGDAPDDWYITYVDPESQLMEVAAYIVTAGGTSVEEAEEDPHAISYDDYKDVKGISLAHTWKFWEWREDSGFTKQLGKAELSELKFLNDQEIDLAPPENFIEIK